MRVFVWIIAIVMLGMPAWAIVKPHALISDNAVLQQGIDVPIWGTACVSEKVTVKFLDQFVSTTAGKDGRWMVRLKPLKAGGPYTMTIFGENTIELKNVMVGEVWICSGQSNMEMALCDVDNAVDVIAASRDARIRVLTVPKVNLLFPATDIEAAWSECGPETINTFSAVGYFFGRDIRKALDVPVGLIDASWGGTFIEAWMPHKTLPDDDNLQNLLKEQTQTRPSIIYNGMIAPLQPYAIRGAIWYQGEANACQAFLYRKRLPDMIRSWREAWGQGVFPFLLVQLAPFFEGYPEPNGSAWAELRESQLITSRTCPKTGMAVITDCGDPKDIHPKRKEPVGTRLALAARAIAYGHHIVYQGPIYKSMKIKGDSIILYFDSIGGGLEAKGGAPMGFTIAGADKKFCPAEAAILDGDKVVVRSAQVPQPVAVRYGWTIYPVVNLYNKAGLPTSPFRTDSFKLFTQPD